MRKQGLSDSQLKDWIIKTKVVTQKDILPDCWENIGTVRIDGYCDIGYNSKNWKSHRLTYYLWFGLCPEDKIINHKCNNKSCCNPLHLEAVSNSENTKYFYNTSSRKSFIHKTKRHNIKDELDYISLVNYIKINSSIVNNIWIWKGGCSKGYPRCKFNKKDRLVHRWIWACKQKIKYEEIPTGIVIRHKDNNKLNVHPDNLISGSQRDNMLDSKWISCNTKLSKNDVLLIKLDFQNWNFSIIVVR